MPDLAIDAERLGRRYGRRWALTDVSLRIPRGSVTMVAGRNGSGKSTLFRVLATALRPDLGRATVLGFDLVRHREDVRKGVALLSHSSYLYEALTATENLEVTADHLGASRAPIAALLERVALAGRGDDPVSTFSAGMRKRVSFARILLQDPRLVLLDEPYAQLDPPGFDLVDSVVRELKAHGVTVLVATHQLDRTAAIADLALHLEAGRVQSFGPVGAPA
ncbi:MAG TPA: heme ABC exporter ATP-binding protein CcmA [Thermoanaerobaculia bacterium]|nr:heme ABC exporter ATP-binding protein CcmA [Thermoanaerobaculia bacterium]